MTIEEMRTRMSNREYLQWRAFHVWRNAEIEKQRKKAEARHRGKR